MKELNQWILCNTNKVPVNISGQAVNPHDPVNWMSHEQAFASAQMLRLHIGFVLTDSDPYWCIDIDHCIVDGVLTPIAGQLEEVFRGCYSEVSLSGEGLHIFGQGEVPDHAKKNVQYGIELYTEGRYILVTGSGAKGSDSVRPELHLLQWLVDSYFPPSAVRTDDEWDISDPLIEDDVLIGKILNSKGSAAQQFGGKASIRQLWDVDDQALATAYPALNDHDVYDRSSADAALASHLAFWTSKNHSQIERIMRRSGLVRDKWDKHTGYMTMTINNAVSGCSNVYSTPPEVDIPVTGDTLSPINRIGVQFMSASQQSDYFKDCIYVKRSHGVLVSNGTIMKPEVFKASYAGYTFSLDASNEKTTKNAWEAFIDNQAVSFPRVDGVCFRPQLAPKELIEEEGMSLVNGYTPVNVHRVKGDVSRFLNHLGKLFPHKYDREIVLAYMAAMVQHIGVKFQWCPIIQGGEGNGKTLLFRVVEKAVGTRLTHYPNAADLAGNGLKFNGWIEGKVAIFIEEIYTSDRRELTEPLKVFVTNDRLEIQYKGRDQYTGDNLANIMMGTNHKDAMKLTYDQRRYCMLYSAQQTEADLIRDGMDGRYFRDLYDWLRNEGGFAMMAEYLSSYKIPDSLNPATDCQRAPKSTSIDEVVASGLGIVEQHILEAIEEGRQGFRGGYISSKCLEDLLKELRLDNKIGPRMRLSIVETLGYQRHPWLHQGRVNNSIGVEGRKSILYHQGAPVGPRVSPAAVKADYELKQGYVNVPLEAVK